VELYHSDIDSEILRWRDGTWKCYSGGNGEGLKTVVGRWVQGLSGWGCMTGKYSSFRSYSRLSCIQSVCWWGLPVIMTSKTTSIALLWLKLRLSTVLHIS
jgi:hypothetical protein